MKFERLNAPGWDLPDLVAFNRRVHEWVDPWWRRKWVRFLTWARAQGVRAVGGLPTGFADVQIPADVLRTLRNLYEAHGARFMVLPNQSRYPRNQFFDTPDHLHEAAQITHSRAVALGLRDQLAGNLPMAPESRPRR